MKNSVIHLGLSNSYLRDFLAISIEKNFELECENKKAIVPYSSKRENAFDWAIRDCENEVVF